MVSNASDDFPEPESPVTTTSLLRGRTRSTFLRLCSRAPLMTIESRDISDELRNPRRLQKYAARIDDRAAGRVGGRCAGRQLLVANVEPDRKESGFDRASDVAVVAISDHCRVRGRTA